MNSAHKTPLAGHLRDRAFWVDLTLLSLLFIGSFFLPLSGPVSHILKIVFLMASLECLGFFLIHLLNGRQSFWIQGLLGGLISSTMVFLRLTDDHELQEQAPLLLCQTLIFATSAMIIQAWLIVLTLAPYHLGHLSPPFVLNILGLAFSFFVLSVILPKGEERSLAFNEGFERPILWRKVASFAAILIGLVYGMRVLTEWLSLPYQVATFTVSLFEAHGVLAAGLTDYLRLGKIEEAQEIILIVLIGHIVSKSVLVGRMRKLRYRALLMIALSAPALLSLISML